MRSTLDRLISWVGLALAVIMLIAGILLVWANRFVADQVHQQLSDQKITMPTDQTGLKAPGFPATDRAALLPYAGQALTSGPQAEAYANHFIQVHLGEMAQGKTYSEVSGQYLQQCPASDPAKAATADCQKLAGLRQTMFMGDTLRGLLLYGYAFATIGAIAGWAAAAAFIGALVLLVLAALGLRHAKDAGGVNTAASTA